MKKLLIIFLFIFSFGKAQLNLVPNPSFETMNTSTLGVVCPTGGIPNYYFSCLLDWYNPSSGYPSGSPDIFASNCSVQCGNPKNNWGIQHSHSGQFYIGIGTYARNFLSTPDYKEYISVKLTDTLKTGHVYCFSMYVSLADSSRYLANPLSVYFSNQDISVTNSAAPLPYTPQLDFNMLNDTSHWIHLQSSYTASGGETYITIGSFKDSANMQLTLIQSLSNTMQNICYYYIDDVSLIETSSCTTGIDEIEKNNGRISVYPNPNNGTFSIAYTFLLAKHSFELYDMMGRKVYEKILNGNEGIETINSEAIGNGVYFYKVLDSNGKLLFTGKLAINK